MESTCVEHQIYETLLCMPLRRFDVSNCSDRGRGHRLLISIQTRGTLICAKQCLNVGRSLNDRSSLKVGIDPSLSTIIGN